MQQQAPYEKEDAENIIRDYLNGWVEWRDDGLFIKQGMLENDVTCSLFQWTPACNMEWDGAPDPATAPSLPFPFTANQLAAFMLNGIGAVVAPAYGTWEHGPDEAAMDEVMGIRERRAREALRKAFSLYREAEKVVGELAPEVQNERRPIHPAILRAQGNKLALQATLEHLSWCRAMTRQLLQPQATTSPAPVPKDAPVGAVIASGAIHSTKTRRDALTPVIELAQSQCRNPKDTAEVWAALLVLAEKKNAPLIGATEDGLQYLKNGSAEILSRKSLGKRLTR